MATLLENDELLQDISRGDIASNEMFYHKSSIKCCYQKFRKKYILKLNSQSTKVNLEEEWIKSAAFNKVCYHITCHENENPGTVFLAKELEELYREPLGSFGIINTSSHVSRFVESLLVSFDNLEKSNVKNKVTVYFKSTIDKYIGESINDASEFIKAAQKIVIPLRKVMTDTNNDFDGSFENDST